LVEQISVTILTKNSSKYLDKCLFALRKFNEIIILDNGSSDDTLEIAKKYVNVKIFENDFIGFGPLKNLAISYTSNDWVLSVDSDEVFSDLLVEEINNIKLDTNTIYSIKRDNFYKNRLIKACGWQDDYVLRLFNKNNTRFNNYKVHESLEIESNTNIKKLNEVFNHYTFDSSIELISKLQNYSTLWAEQNKGKKKSSPIKALLRFIFSFFKNYFLQKGFLYGYEGLLISISNANGVFYKYIKLYELNKNDN
jgi:glycosyltransferase involved in cell wall biosynthesis